MDIFDESQQTTAEKSRLSLEIDLNRNGIDDEVVLLQAENEGAVRHTHRRYFEDLSQLFEDLRQLLACKTSGDSQF